MCSCTSKENERRSVALPGGDITSHTCATAGTKILVSSDY